MPDFTPDKRYLIVNGVLWRTSNPHLAPERRAELVRDLMNARRAVKAALAIQAKSGDTSDLRKARREVHKAKVGLGERGPVWWDDGDPDYNRRKAANTPYGDLAGRQ
jgi:hypothetical protein